MIRLFVRALGYLLAVAALTVIGGMIGFQQSGTVGAAIGGSIGFILAAVGAAYMNNLEVANSH